ncbi:MAG: hypothetical protein MZU97_03280 [Bacillus subtilis]|nr:hypothetical protein [Bacillus subtilis]
MGKSGVSGAKNSALPLIAASILSRDGLDLCNVPDVADVRMMLSALEILGIEHSFDGSARRLSLMTANLENREIPYDIVRKMRASVLVMGPLLARFGEAHVYTPGRLCHRRKTDRPPCRGVPEDGIGVPRPFGVCESRGESPKGGTDSVREGHRNGDRKRDPWPRCSPGRTTVIENAALEPEVVDLVPDAFFR